MPALLIVAGPAEAFSPTNGGAYYIKEFSTGKCLDVRDASVNNGARLQRWDCGPQWNQQFIFTEPGYQTGRLSWKIKPRYLQSKCLDAKDGLHASTPVQQWDCHVGWQQRWVIINEPVTPYYTLHAAYDLNYCLDIPGSSNGWLAYIHPCDGTFGQIFRP